MARYEDAKGEIHTVPSTSCNKTLLCPICAARRAAERKVDLSHRVKRIKLRKRTRWIFITLTGGRTVKQSGLKKRIRELLAARKKFFRELQADEVILGSAWGFETAHSTSPTGDYHPHLHILVAVDQSYYRGGGPALTLEDLRDRWGKLMRWNPIDEDGDEIEVDIRAADRDDRGSLKLAQAFEVAKYVAKPASEGDHAGEWWEGLRSSIPKGTGLAGLTGIFNGRTKLWKSLPKLAKKSKPKPVKILGFYRWTGRDYDRMPDNVIPMAFKWLLEQVGGVLPDPVASSP